MEVPRTAIKIVKKKKRIIGFTIYSTILKSTIKVNKNALKGFKLNDLSHDARLKKENGEWYLCISYDVEPTSLDLKEKTCALDPGVRKFQTIYSEDQVITIAPDKEKIKKLYAVLDKFQELRAKKLIRQRTYDRKRCRI